jgi:hypothetical protein
MSRKSSDSFLFAMKESIAVLELCADQMFVCLYLCLQNQFIIFTFLHVAKPLSFNPLVFVTGSPKLTEIYGFHCLLF